MKNTILILLLLIVIIIGCHKEKLIPTDGGCMEWKKTLVNDHSGFMINNTNIQTIDGLFSSNGIDNSKYRYFYYANDSFETNFPPYPIHDETLVKVREFTNGLEIFNSAIHFIFWDDTLHFQGTDPTSGTTLNTIPQLTEGQIRTLFLGHMEQFEQLGGLYKDSCFVAEFGYFNLNARTNEATEKLVKTWKVTLKSRIYPSEVPIAYYKDDDGGLIYYDNGIRTFH